MSKKKVYTRDIARGMSRILKEHGVESSVDMCETHLAAFKIFVNECKENKIPWHFSQVMKCNYKQRESTVKWNKYKKYKYRTNPAWYAEIKLLGYLAELDEEPNFDIFANVPEEKFEYAIPKKDYYDMKIAMWERKKAELEAQEGDGNGDN